VGLGGEKEDNREGMRDEPSAGGWVNQCGKNGLETEWGLVFKNMAAPNQRGTQVNSNLETKTNPISGEKREGGLLKPPKIPSRASKSSPCTEKVKPKR